MHKLKKQTVLSVYNFRFGIGSILYGYLRVSSASLETDIIFLTCISPKLCGSSASG